MDNPNDSFRQPLTTSPPRGWIRWTALVLAGAGWWMSLDLALIGYGKDANTPWLQSQCGKGAGTDSAFDCRSVLASRYSSIPLSQQSGAPKLPIAVLGMGYFGFVGVWFFFVGPPTRRRWGWHILPLIVIGCGLLQSLYMVQVMGGVLHKWCSGCLATHAINGCLALLAIIAIPWRRDRAETTPHPSGRLACATLLAAVLLFAMHPTAMLMLIANAQGKRVGEEYLKIVNDPEYARWSYSREAEHPELNAADRDYWGDPAAPNTVVIFSDVQCSACAEAYAVLAGLMDRRPGVIRVDCREFPLDAECNDTMPEIGHPASCAASRATEAARLVGGDASFRKMRMFLYEHRHELETARYDEWAGELGLDQKAFADALDSPAVADRVQADIELGKNLGVAAVPVLFLNGRRLNHWKNPATWDALLDLPAEPPTSAPAAP